MIRTFTPLHDARQAVSTAIFSLLILFGAATVAAQITGPEQDCFNAIPVCNGVYIQTNSYTGEGSVTGEIDPLRSCLGRGERNNVWYIFTVRSSGNLAFTITPININNDYDWAVFNLTGRSCSDIRNGGLEVSCNYSSTSGTTGATVPGGLSRQDASGTPFNGLIPVLAGETYVLNVSNFDSVDQEGYRLDFTSSTAEIFDQAAPVFQSAQLPTLCEAGRVIARFSENVLCSSVSPDDFRLTGPGGPYTITAVSSVNCAAGAGFEDAFELLISPELSGSGAYTLELVADGGGVLDICGNTATPVSRPFFASPLARPTIQIDGPTTFCSCQELTLTAPAGYSSYRWSSGETTPSIRVLDGGSYSVTVANNFGCSSTSEEIDVSRVDAESTINLPETEVHASPGDTVTIPISIASSQYLDFCGARSYTIRMFYNRNILKALDGNCVETRGDTCFLELRGTRSDSVGLLASPRFLAMLGNAENTPLVIERAGWDECATLTLTNGSGFQLDDLCREGGTRLYKAGPSPVLKPLRPSPVRGTVSIDYTLGVDCHARISFIDLMGNEVAIALDAPRPTGEGSQRVDLSALPPGLYLCTLTAQGETHTQMVEVIR